MNSILRSALAASTVAIATQAAAQVTLYEHPNFQGQSFTTQQQLGNLERNGFNNRASSAVVRGETWQVCDGPGYSGQCAILRPGEYPSLGAMGLNDSISSIRAANTDVRGQGNRYAPAVAGQITFYENERFTGQSFTTEQSIGSLERSGFNNRASSAVVRGETWQVCDGPGFGGRCAELRPGDYASLSAMGLNDRISSVRAVNRDARTDDNRYAPAPAAHDYRRRSGERLYEANVTSVRAVLGTPEQRCWVEREQISQDRRNVNVPGAVAGAVIGGIIGHQIGSGRNQNLATAGGAVAGGVVGANVGRSGDGQYSQDVQRCETVNNQARPDHWDVTYSFRGQEHRMQMTSPPGPTVTVNEQGEPRA